MKKQKHVILYSVLGVLLLLSAAAGVYYRAAQEKTMRQLELGYGRRLAESEEQLHGAALLLSKIPAVEEPALLQSLLGQAAMQAEGVVSGLSALPLSHWAIEETVTFMNGMADYTRQLSRKLAEGERLSGNDRIILEEMYSQCVLLLGQYALSRDRMLAQSLHLAGMENVYYESASADQRPMEKLGEEGMAFSSALYQAARKKEPKVYKALPAQDVDEMTAIELAKKFVGEERVKEAVPGAPVSGSLPCFGITLTLQDGTVLNAGITRQGGKMLWMMPEKASFSGGLTLAECSEKAGAFLESRGFGAMEVSHYQIYDGLAVLEMAPLQDGVLLYPDRVKLQLRMDTGEVVGIETHHYLENHCLRTLPEPQVDREQLLTAAGARLQNAEIRLCLLPLSGGERLCYELRGEAEEKQYYVYVDAMTGEEVEVLLVVEDAGGEYGL